MLLTDNTLMQVDELYSHIKADEQVIKVCRQTDGPASRWIRQNGAKLCQE